MTTLLASLLLIAGSGRAATASYRILDLGDLGGGFARARAVNASGTVVGESLIPVAGTIERAFRWEAGILSDLGTLGGTRSRAVDVNDSGLAVGWALDAGGLTKPAQWSATGISALPTLGGLYGTAWGANNLDVIVGHTYVSSTTYRATRWLSGIAQDLGTLGGTYSIAYDINDTGLVVGAADITTGQQHACLWLPSGPADLSSLSGGNWHTVRAVNAAGSLILWGAPLGITANRAAFWGGAPGDIVVDLGTFGGDESWAYGLNNLGHVVGWAEFELGNYHGFVWNGTEKTDLGTLGGLFSSAYGINDDGVIVGWAHDSQGRTHAVAWVPVPEPASVAALGFASLMACLCHRRTARKRAP